MNSRQMQQAMRRMGLKQEDIPAKKVIIVLDDAQIVLHNPSVTHINMSGQESYQISGEEELIPLNAMPDITAEDIQTVAQATGKSEKAAEQAIKDSRGDLAAAILKLT